MVTSKCTHASAPVALRRALFALTVALRRALFALTVALRRALFALTVALLLLVAAPAVAAEPEPEPAVHHVPVASAKSGEPLVISAAIDAPQAVRNAFIVYRAGGRWLSVRLLRSETGYSARIPAEHVTGPDLAYAIELERTNGQRTAIFATRAEPQPVVVHDDPTDTRERWLLDRLQGRRSVVSVTGELVRFGTTEGKYSLECPSDQGPACPEGQTRVPVVDDQYWRAEASYIYRPLRAVSELGFKLGVVRGRSVVDVGPTETYDDDRFDVGLNYAGANVRFRLADIFHTDLEILGSVTEIGFSAGGGAAVLLGDPHGFKLTLGWQTIGFTPSTYFGTRFYTRLDLPVTSRITLAPNVEVTDMPHADRFGVRLLADGGFYLGKGFTLWLRGGYQARVARSGGPAGGATLQLAF